MAIMNNCGNILMLSAKNELARIKGHRRIKVINKEHGFSIWENISKKDTSQPHF